MTTSSSVGVEGRLHVESPTVRRLYWSVRRELWENRSIYLAPAAVAAVFLIGFFISLFGLPGRLSSEKAMSPQQQALIEQPYVLVAIMLMAISLIVAAFYCLDALYGERRDRSILFWKSLPVSDLTTVLSKASIPIVVLPFVTFVITVVTQLIMLLVSSVVLAASGMSVALPWTHVPFFRTTMINLVHLVGYHGLWYAPFYGWLLLVSAWARRTPFLWAVLPLVAIGAIERIAFNTSHFATMVRYRLIGAPDAGGDAVRLTMDVLAGHPIGHFLVTPGLWAGLALTAVFLFAAIRLHRSRGPI